MSWLPSIVKHPSSLVMGKTITLARSEGVSETADNSCVERSISENESVPPLTQIFVIGGLGSGSFGVVVEIEIKGLDASVGLYGQRFAMKCMSKDKFMRPNTRQTLQNEISVLNLRPSRFLLSSLFMFETSTDIFIVTDLLKGGDLFFRLDQTIEQGRVGFKEDQSRTLLAEISLGLVHLHSFGFVHRDIKIENIMLDERGHVKLVDFGLATKLMRGGKIVEEVQVSPAGSLNYMAPELLKGTAGRFTDWWALGVLAFELFTGRSPWSSLTNFRRIKKEIRSIEVQLPVRFSHSSREFVAGLLCRSYVGRIGFRSDDDVVNSTFFSSLDWESFKNGENEPAVTPTEDSISSVEDSMSIVHEYEALCKRADAKKGKPFLFHLGLKTTELAPQVHTEPRIDRKDNLL
jgi:serine/threonine protein kinase